MMKIKLFLCGILLAGVFNSCMPKYLPKPKEIDINRYGAQMKIKKTDRSVIKGELISVDSNSLIILRDGPLLIPDSTRNAILIPSSDIKRYTVRFARVNYIWSVPVYSLSIAAHILTAVYSYPVNLITTTFVVASASWYYTHKSKDLSYDELRMFARFPQGLPPDIDIEELNER